MKRFIIITVVALMLVTMLAACERKTSPDIKLNVENVTSVEFKKTYYTGDKNDPRVYKQKTLTDKQDIQKLADWIVSLELTKHDAIEVPIEEITYAIMLKGKVSHRVVFMGDYIIYDNQAYTFDNKNDKTAVENKYNLLGYTETDTTLDLISR